MGSLMGPPDLPVESKAELMTTEELAEAINNKEVREYLLETFSIAKKKGLAGVPDERLKFQYQLTRLALMLSFKVGDEEQAKKTSEVLFNLKEEMLRRKIFKAPVDKGSNVWKVIGIIGLVGISVAIVIGLSKSKHTAW